MVYGDFKDINRRTAANKVLCDKNPKYDGYQHGHASMVFEFFHKKLLAVVLKMRIFQTKN